MVYLKKKKVFQPKFCICWLLFHYWSVTYYKVSIRHNSKMFNTVSSCGQQSNGPPNWPVFMPKPVNVSHGKKELRLQKQVRLLISWPLDGKMILDYLPAEERSREMASQEGFHHCYWLWRWRKVTRSQGIASGFWKLERAGPLELPAGMQAPQTS